jgi:hypothetical protein
MACWQRDVEAPLKKRPNIQSPRIIEVLQGLFGGTPMRHIPGQFRISCDVGQAAIGGRVGYDLTRIGKLQNRIRCQWQGQLSFSSKASIKRTAVLIHPTARAPLPRVTIARNSPYSMVTAPQQASAA